MFLIRKNAYKRQKQIICSLKWILELTDPGRAPENIHDI